MKPCQVPSKSSNQISDDLFIFLNDKLFRKKYNKILRLAKKFRNLEAKVDQLKTCIDEKLISTDFKLSKPKHDYPIFNQVKEASEAASIEWMKVALEENEASAEDVINELTDSFNELCINAPQNIQEELKARLQFKSHSFKIQATKVKELKLSKLRTNGTPFYNIVSEDKSKKAKRVWVKRSKYKRQKKSKLKQKISVVFNYSSINLTESMEKVLNRGLNFAIMPLKLNMTQVLVDYKQFERTIIWQEFWFGRDKVVYKPPIFKTKKSNLPSKHPTPPAVKVFLNSVKSEIMDPENRNKARPNLPPDEIKALSELIELQRNRVITIKPCDKGAGIIILDFEEYLQSCNQHLNAKQPQVDGTFLPYYQKVTDETLNIAKEKIVNLIQEGFDNEYISNDEFNAMDPSDKGPGKFYELFKVHKPHETGKAPPERPIISGSGSVTENISLFVEHHIKHLANAHPSYLQDTPDFLRQIEDLNSEGPLPSNAILVSIDVSALYTNIPQEEGLDATREALEIAENLTIPSEFILRLLDLVLKYNIFEFNQELFIQLIGTAMGTRPAPSYANIFMAKKIDPKILEAASNFGDGVYPVRFLKRFLDDIFLIFIGSIAKLHSFLSEINSIHPTIKFTMSHTTPENLNETPCSCVPSSSLAFLDTSCSLKNGKIIVDLYRKPTDRNQYLLTSSCHPAHVTSNIPYSLAYRIVRICSEPAARDQRLLELRQLLLARDYKAGIVDAAIARAKTIPRSEAIKKVAKPNNDTVRPILVVPYDPRLPAISTIVKKHWRSMTTDPYLKEVFPLPPMVAYKRPANIRDKLIRSKVPEKGTKRVKRKQTGCRKCNNCNVCPFMQNCKVVKSSATDFNVEIEGEVNCQTKNVIYCITCKKCKEQYVGETERIAKDRFREHIGYVRNEQLEKATGFHFNQKGHSIADMEFAIIEKVFSKDPRVRKERESLFIKNFNVKHKGINKIY